MLFRVEQLHQALFKDPCLPWLVAAEEEERAKLCAEAEKIGILAVAAVNTDANVLPRLGLALVPVVVDMPNI